MFDCTATSTLRRTALAAAACFAATLAAGSSAAEAHAANTNGKCPAGYDLIVTTPSYCLSKTGDVVEPDVERQGLSCPTGYEWLAHLCFSPATGDIVLASEDRELAAAQRADVAGTSK